MRSSKAKSQTKHFKRRLRERFGVNVSKHKLKQIIQKIQKGDAVFIRRQSLRTTIWEVEVEGEVARVVYDAKRHTVVTAMRVPYQRGDNIYRR